MSWTEFLGYLSRPNGIAVSVGIIWSVLVEYWPWFATLEPKWKRALFFGVSLLIPILAATVGCLTTGWAWNWEQTFWPALAAGFLAFTSGTVAHLRKL